MHRENDRVVRRASVVCLLSLALLAACQDPVRTGLDVAPTPAPSGDDAIATLRSRQYLRYEMVASDLTSTSGELPFIEGILDRFASEFGQEALPAHEYAQDNPIFDAILQDCTVTSVVEGQATFNTCGGTATCTATACWVETRTCVTNRLLEIAAATQLVEIRRWDQEGHQIGTLRLPVQSRPTRAALREAAVVMTAWMANGINLLGNPNVLSTGNGAIDCATVDVVDGHAMSRAERLFIDIRELIELSREAGRAAVADYLALADAAVGERTQASEGAHDARAIRLVAASIVNGAYPAWLPSEAFETCSGQSLTPDEQRALDAFRGTGLPPGDVDSTLSLDALLNGTDTRHGLAQRYFVTRSRPTDAVASDRVARMLLDLGLTRSHFAVARQQLIEEYSVYHRSRSATDPQRRISVPGASGADEGFYLATGTAPTVPNWAIFAAQTRRPGLPALTLYPSLVEGTDGGITYDASTEGGVVQPSVDAGPFGGDYAYGGFAYIASGSVSIATQHFYIEAMLRRFRQTWSTQDGAAAHELDVAARNVQDDLREDVEGLVVVHVQPGAPDVVHLVISSSVASAPDLLVVGTDDALSCAVSGTVEGAECDATQLAPLGVATALLQGDSPTVSDAVRASVGSLFAADPYRALLIQGELFPFAATIDLPATTKQVHILRRRTGAAAGTPGAYQLLANAYLPTAEIPEAWLNTNGYLDLFPAVPRLEQEAGSLLTPSRSRCEQAELTCAGVSYDSRLPLEDELIDDGSAYENSWYILLQRARAAAERADALGEEALATELDVARMAEDELAQVEQVCGADVPLTAIKAALQGGGVDAPTNSITTALARLTPVGNRYLPQGAAPQLLACLSESAQVDAVLGQKPTCAWRFQGALCRTANSADAGNHQCPEPALASEPCFDPDGAGSAYQAVRIDATLGILDDATAGGSGSNLSSTALCNDVRSVREELLNGTATDATTGETIRRVFSHVAFSSQAVRAAAQTIRWEAGVGTYASLFLGERAWRSSGSAEGGSSNAAYCDGLTTTRPVGCEDGAAPNSLRCAEYTCTNLPWRVSFAERTLRAAYFARYLGGATISDFRFAETDDGNKDGTQSFSYPELGEVLAEGSSSARQYCWNTAHTPAISDVLWRFPGTATTDASPYDCAKHGGHSAPGYLLIRKPVHSWGRYEIDNSGDVDDASTLLLRLRTSRLDGTASARDPFAYLHAATPIDPSHSFDPRCPDGRCGTRQFPWYRAGVENRCRTTSTSYLTEECFLQRNSEATARASAGPFPYGREPQTITTEQFFDALELICEASDPVNYVDGFGIPEISSKSEATRAAEDLSRFASVLRDQYGQTILEDVPSDIVTTIKGFQGASPVGLQGAYGGQVLRVRGAISTIANAGAELAMSLENVSRGLRTLDSQLEVIDAQSSIQKWAFTSQVTQISMEFIGITKLQPIRVAAAASNLAVQLAA